MIRLALRLIAAAVLMAAIMFPATVSAEYKGPFSEACEGGGAGSAVCSNGTGGADPIAGPNGAIVNVTTILAIVAGIVAVAFLVWGGVKYITSGGDSSGVASAKNTIIAALVGLVLAALARPIVTFVVGKL